MADSRHLVDEARAASRARFARLVARPEPEIELALGALIIAGHGRAPVDEPRAFDRLDALAEHVRLRIDAGDPEDVVLDRLPDLLHREAHFRGPKAADYGEPANSFLDAVLSRRVGLPISLAIVELETGWRLGIPLVGVGLPGHFIVGGPDGLLFDPVDGGRRLTSDDCQALIRRSIGEGVLLQAGMLRPIGRRQILARVLRNLRAAHPAPRDWPAPADANRPPLRI